MTVRLDPNSERLIEQPLRAGHFRSAEEVVARALETLAENESMRSEEQGRRRAVQKHVGLRRETRLHLGEGLDIRHLIHEGQKQIIRLRRHRRPNQSGSKPGQ
jgi:Arc/MetJ-type ribon-helix-helix transcriptional regulator